MSDRIMQKYQIVKTLFPGLKINQTKSDHNTARNLSMTPNLQKYKITLSGCNDETTIIVGLSSEQLSFLKTLEAKFLEKSFCDCMPVMYVETPDECLSDEVSLVVKPT